MQFTNLPQILLLLTSALSVTALPVQSGGAALEPRLLPGQIGYVRTERLPGTVNKWWDARKAAANEKKYAEALKKEAAYLAKQGKKPTRRDVAQEEDLQVEDESLVDEEGSDSLSEDAQDVEVDEDMEV